MVRALHSIALAVLLAACATSAVQPDSASLSCGDLETAYAIVARERLEAEGGMAEVDTERRRFFAPLILGTILDPSRAVHAAEAKKNYIARLMRERNCPRPVGVIARA